jgi:hypothetical protein
MNNNIEIIFYPKSLFEVDQPYVYGRNTYGDREGSEKAD